MMTDQDKKEVYVRVKDGAGNQFLCPLDALKDIRHRTLERLGDYGASFY